MCDSIFYSRSFSSVFSAGHSRLIGRLEMLVRYLMAPSASFLRWRVLIPSGPMTVEDLANRIASFVSASVKDGVPVTSS